LPAGAGRATEQGDLVAVHVHGLDAAVLDEAPGQHVGRPVPRAVVDRPVALVAHTGERAVHLEADHADATGGLLGDGD